MLNIIENFPILFDSKEKVKELRNLILSLAIQGKLAPQDPGDEPASVLLKRIEEEKKRLVKEKKIKKEKPLPSIHEKGEPYMLPEGWERIRLGDTILLLSGRDLPLPDCNDKDIGIPYIMGASNIQAGKLQIERWVEKPQVISEKGDLLLTVKGTVGKTLVLNEFERVNLSRQVVAIRQIGNQNIDYLHYFIKHYMVNLISKSRGLIPGISREDILEIVYLVPPRCEQYRIVQKINELMALCDELEKALEKKAQSKELASKSISNLIQKSENQEQLKTNLTLLINMFKEVYSTKANIRDLRDTILRLAIQGKLVPQDPKDEPASVLLKQIEEEKKRLVKEKKIKKAIPLPPISEDERPFELPNGWGYVRLGNIGYFENGDRSSEYPKENELVNNGIPFINTKNMFDGYINLNENQLNFITKEKFQALRSGKLVNGDFLFVLRGSVGKNAVFRSNHLYNTGFINAQLLIVRSHLSLINEYLRYFFKSNLYNSQIVQMSSGSAQPQLAASNLKMMVIPLPPILEQQRIVQKVDELMALCDELEKHIEATVYHSDNLMKSIIKAAI